MTEQDFLDAIIADPKDPTPRLVFADWLDEMGDARGELLRIQEELRHIDVPNRSKIETRQWELLDQGIEPLLFTKTNSINMRFVLIFPGEFFMGSPESEWGRHPCEHLHPVRITEPFWMSIHQFTERDYFWIFDEERSGFAAGRPGSRRQQPQMFEWIDGLKACNHLSEMENLRLNYQFSAGLTPSELRLTIDSKGWLNSNGYRLPTEAEWEYACRGGMSSATPYGPNLSKEDAHYAAGKRRRDSKVGKHRPNAYGLYDMIGNAWEWCWDWLKDDYYLHSPKENPAGPKQGTFRVARGGGPRSNAQSCRSAFRNRLTPTNQTDACLRLVLPWQPQ